MDHVEIEFVGGPQDGKVISVRLPLEAGGAPRWIQFVVNPAADPALWPAHLSAGTLVDRYRAPAGDDELGEAVAAYSSGEPLKYRYDGQGVTE